MNMHVGSSEFSRLQASGNRPSVNFEAAPDNTSVWAQSSQGAGQSPKPFAAMATNPMQMMQMMMSIMPMIMMMKSMGLDTSAMFGGGATQSMSNKPPEDVLKVGVKQGDTIESIVKEQYKAEIEKGANGAAQKKILAEKIAQVKKANKLSGDSGLRTDKELILPGLIKPAELEVTALAVSAKTEVSTDKPQAKPLFRHAKTTKPTVAPTMSAEEIAAKSRSMSALVSTEKNRQVVDMPNGVRITYEDETGQKVTEERTFDSLLLSRQVIGANGNGKYTSYTSSGAIKTQRDIFK